MGQEVIYILLACAIVTSILLLSLAVRTQSSLDDLQNRKPEIEAQIKADEEQINKLKEQMRKEEERSKNEAKEKAQLEKAVANLNAKNEQYKKEVAELKSNAYNNDQPPIILLTESGGFTFETGSAKLSPNFRENVKYKILPNLKESAERYSARIIEIVGHTDEVPFGAPKRGLSDLDTNLFKALSGTAPAGALIPYDNVGLGMARAISVRQLLLELGLGANFTILPLSAGPAITPSEAIAFGASPHTGIEARRRIEIRLRRRSKNEG
jgi:flagellar motor protein MotB